MGTALRASRATLLLGLLSCLLGVASILASYFALPLNAVPEAFGGRAETAWQWVMGTVNNMLIVGVTPGFLIPIGLMFLPVATTVLLGLLAFMRVAFATPFLATLYLIIFVLGCLPLVLILPVIFFSPRIGALGGLLGYALCFVGDRLLRRARQPSPVVAA